MKAHCIAFSLLLMGGVAMADSEPPLRFAMPDTGLAPSYGKAEFNSCAKDTHGGASMSWSSYRMVVPFLDSRKSRMGMWRVNAALDANATVFSTHGDMHLSGNELYTFSLPVTFIRPQTDGGYLALGVAPCIASDFEGSAPHGWDVLAFATYKVKVSDTCNYTVGAALSPRFAKYVAMPLIGFSWTLTPEWEIRLDGYELSALYRPVERLQIGPFIAACGGTWMVDTEQGDSILRMNNLVVGVTAEYDFHRGDQPKRIIFASVGVNIFTRVDLCERKGWKESYDMRHFKPGVVANFGVDFRF